MSVCLTGCLSAVSRKAGFDPGPGIVQYVVGGKRVEVVVVVACNSVQLTCNKTEKGEIQYGQTTKLKERVSCFGVLL